MNGLAADHFAWNFYNGMSFVWFKKQWPATESLETHKEPTKSYGCLQRSIKDK